MTFGPGDAPTAGLSSPLLSACLVAALEGRRSQAPDALTLSVRAGRHLFHAGDPSDAVYLLTSGDLRLAITAHGRRAGERTTLLVRAPALIGARDLLARVPAMESAVCLTTCELASWDADTLLSQWPGDERLRSVITLDLARAYAASLRISQVLDEPLEKCLEALLDDAHANSRPAPSPKELALICGVTVKTVQRALPRVTPGQADPPAGEPMYHSLFDVRGGTT